MAIPEDGREMHEYPPPPTRAGNARRWTIAAFVLAGLSVLFAPILLGPAAIIVGIVARRKGDPLAGWAIAAGVAGLLLGVALAAALVDDAEALALLG